MEGLFATSQGRFREVLAGQHGIPHVVGGQSDRFVGVGGQQPIYQHRRTRAFPALLEHRDQGPRPIGRQALVRPFEGLAGVLEGILLAPRRQADACHADQRNRVVGCPARRLAQQLQGLRQVAESQLDLGARGEQLGMGAQVAGDLLVHVPRVGGAVEAKHQVDQLARRLDRAGVGLQSGQSLVQSGGVRVGFGHRSLPGLVLASILARWRRRCPLAVAPHAAAELRTRSGGESSRPSIDRCRWPIWIGAIVAGNTLRLLAERAEALGSIMSGVFRRGGTVEDERARVRMQRTRASSFGVRADGLFCQIMIWSFVQSSPLSTSVDRAPPAPRPAS